MNFSANVYIGLSYKSLNFGLPTPWEEAPNVGTFDEGFNLG